MKRVRPFVIVVFMCGITATAVAAQNRDLAACSVVTATEAVALVGGPLDRREFAKTPTANGPGTHDSICTYIAKGGNFENAVSASRLLDLTLHFLQSSKAAKDLFDSSIEQYRQMAKVPDAPFKNAKVTPIDGFGDRAFVLEAVTDQKTKYKSALIVFVKGKVGGAVGAWNSTRGEARRDGILLRKRRDARIRQKMANKRCAAPNRLRRQ